jgi:hypothetical protein
MSEVTSNKMARFVAINNSQRMAISGTIPDPQLLCTIHSIDSGCSFTLISLHPFTPRGGAQSLALLGATISVDAHSLAAEPNIRRSVLALQKRSRWGITTRLSDDSR